MENQAQPVVRSFPTPTAPGKNPLMILMAIGVVVILAGVGTGWSVAQMGGSSSTNENMATAVGNSNANDTEAGISDESKFEKEAPEGVLEEGGIEGEGTHHIDRGAGPSKVVYLTSTVINLDNFVGKKVKVWGNTVAAQSAPWLMDVGKIKVID